MAETFLRSADNVVNREYDYIVIGTYLIRSRLTFLILVLTRTIGGGVSVTSHLPTHCAGSHARTAGLVVATRLTEDPTLSVLVLEA